VAPHHDHRRTDGKVRGEFNDEARGGVELGNALGAIWLPLQVFDGLAGKNHLRRQLVLAQLSTLAGKYKGVSLSLARPAGGS